MNAFGTGLDEVYARRTVLRAGFAGALGLGAGALLAACGGDDGGSGGGGSARVEDTQAGTAGAVVRPIIEKEHLDPGVRLTYVAGTGPGDVQNKLLSGALDVASMGPLGAVTAAEAGADVVVFAASLNNHVRWLVPENSPYRTPADLRGKPVATPPKNSDAYRSAQLAAAVNGISFEEEYKVHPGAVLAGLALFERGDVEAIVTIEPNATRLVGKGARVLATVTDLWRQGTGESGQLVLNGQGAKRAWVERNRAAATALSKVRRQAYERIHERPQVLAELHTYYGIPAQERRAIELLPKLADIYPLEWGEPVFAGLRGQIDVAVKNGLLKGRPARDVLLDVG